VATLQTHAHSMSSPEERTGERESRDVKRRIKKTCEKEGEESTRQVNEIRNTCTGETENDWTLVTHTKLD
jgi:hypothetical protein